MRAHSRRRSSWRRLIGRRSPGRNGFPSQKTRPGRSSLNRMPPWTAENAITDDLARTLIEAQFPQLAPVSIRLLGAGWDNSALLINEEFVFRFPRRQPG